MTIFPFLHDWSTGSRCVLAYTTTETGTIGAVGVIPIEGNVFEPGDLFAMAGRHGFIGEWKGSHEQRCGCWLACTGYSARSVPKPGTIDVQAEWSMDMVKSVKLDSPYYGHLRVVAGRFHLQDEELLAQARALVPLPVA
ncbi:hypothetical protein U5640_17005 [Streptomyces sp. SS7]|uniref:hypothetical protein n=1 Tax=Streptomyces sp. SS7 TaxID=3108485 RepID=UPI0030EC2315